MTIGKFFAVHRGHQALLRATVEAARAADAEAVAVTFDRHPLEVLRPGTRLPLLATLDERLDLIEALGIDTTVVARVTTEFLAQEPEEFVRRVLVEDLGAVEVLASGNFRFGHRARGDTALLRRLGAELGFRFIDVPPVMEGGERISSSRIARCIEAGRVLEAARLLGRPYSIAGEVVAGEQLGRRLGFPTANVQLPPERLLPADGVYVVQAEWNGGAVPGVANLGVRPTLGGRQRLLEVHLPAWEGDLYGRELRVAFLDYLRGEERFPDLEALKAQIARDVETARSRFPAP
ncbi:MAG TPA: bifunctional riboflavin kinase/FAD synthetase [Armatimonadota bacterium]|nr:bifunctional riboflavin kinase/FAD synthetase [Armatimonadota bacterium]